MEPYSPLLEMCTKRPTPCRGYAASSGTWVPTTRELTDEAGAAGHHDAHGSPMYLRPRPGPGHLVTQYVHDPR